MCVGARTVRVASCIYACSVTFYHDDGSSTAKKVPWETYEMDNEIGINPVILVVEDVHETRDGIEKLLKVDGYRVMLARDELDAIESAQRQRPDLILVSLAGLPGEVLGSGRRIRESAAAGDDVPVVIFCFDEIPEGAEVAIGKNVHIAQPDNFNQLRRLLSRLLRRITTAA
jgi:DNA-binding response OmpR family regulator